MRHRRFRHAPRPIEPGCPTWCRRDHALDLDDQDGMILHVRECGHGVEVVAVDLLGAGTRTPAEVTVRDTSCETPAEAQRLALAILEAADFLDGGR